MVALRIHQGQRLFQFVWGSVYIESDMVPKYRKYIGIGVRFPLTQHGCSDNLFGTLVLIIAIRLLMAFSIANDEERIL